MKAIRVEQVGGPEVLKLEDVAPIEEPGPGQAVVRIVAAGVNFIDVQQRSGRYPAKVPFTPGLEAAGVVESLSDGISHVKPGDRVAYTGQLGAYAEASAVDAHALIPLPDEITFEQGAAIPLQGMTAHYLIHEYRKPKAGDVVLVHAAAGGMGLLLVQWSKHLGAHVIGTVSSEEKAKVARQAGAHDVINYTQKNFAEEVKRLTGGKGADIIFDAVGKSTFPGDLEAVKTRGLIVVFGAASGMPDPITPVALMPRAITVSGGSLQNFTTTREEILRRSKDVMRGIEDGWLKMRIEHVFPLAQAAEAHRMLEGRKTTGKVVLLNAN